MSQPQEFYVDEESFQDFLDSITTGHYPPPDMDADVVPLTNGFGSLNARTQSAPGMSALSSYNLNTDYSHKLMYKAVPMYNYQQTIAPRMFGPLVKMESDDQIGFAPEVFSPPVFLPETMGRSADFAFHLARMPQSAPAPVLPLPPAPRLQPQPAPQSAPQSAAASDTESDFSMMIDPKLKGKKYDFIHEVIEPSMFERPKKSSKTGFAPLMKVPQIKMESRAMALNADLTPSELGSGNKDAASAKTDGAPTDHLDFAAYVNLPPINFDFESFVDLATPKDEPDAPTSESDMLFSQDLVSLNSAQATPAVPLAPDATSLPSSPQKLEGLGLHLSSPITFQNGFDAHGFVLEFDAPDSDMTLPESEPADETASGVQYDHPPELSTELSSILSTELKSEPSPEPTCLPAELLMAQPVGKFAILVAVDNVAERLRRALIVPAKGTQFTMMENRYLESGKHKMQRTFRAPGSRGGLSTTSTRSCDITSGHAFDLSGAQLMEACITQVRHAVSRRQGHEHKTAVDSAIYMGNLSSKRSGIPVQFPALSGTVRPELVALIDDWTSRRPRCDSFFRLTDETGEAFNLEELQVAVSILTSRPPRRINHYPAPQIFADEHLLTGSKGELLVTWDQRTFSSRSPSEDMRRRSGVAPPLGDDIKDSFEEDGLPGDRSDEISHYKPRYVMGRGSDKHGWCDHCPNGGFFKVKNSGYLYHKNHEHGIFANGNVFEDPLCIRRKLERDTKWEGLCGICYRWVDVDHKDTAKWGTWFRHYNNCTKEYDELKTAILCTGAPVQFVEIEYQPYEDPQSPRKRKHSLFAPMSH